MGSWCFVLNFENGSFGSAKLQQIKNEIKRIVFIVVIDSHNRARTYLFINRNNKTNITEICYQFHTKLD